MNAIPPKKVAMVVANIPHIHTGKGGHYYSTREIYLALKSRLDVNLIVVGHSIPDALQDIDGIELVRVGRFLSPGGIIALLKIFRGRSVDVAHCMDSSALLYSRLAAHFLRLPIVWTKCGGRTLRRYTPRRAPDTVFHKDDLDFYRSKGFAPRLIPNRISVQATVTANPRSIRTGATKLRFVRVSRICRKYEDGLLKSIAFVRALNEAGIPADLDVIGYLEDSEVFGRLERAASAETRILTSAEWTTRASRRLGDYDAAIATGRAAMEALAMGMPTFATPARSPAPVFIGRENFPTLLNANISERAPVANDMDVAVHAVRNLYASDEALSDYRSWCLGTAGSELDVQGAVGKYTSVYASANYRFRVSNIWDLIKHVGSFHLAMI